MLLNTVTHRLELIYLSKLTLCQKVMNDIYILDHLPKKYFILLVFPFLNNKGDFSKQLNPFLFVCFHTLQTRCMFQILYLSGKK